MAIKIILLIAYLVVMPVFTGSLFVKSNEVKTGFNLNTVLKALLFGLVTEWAFFYVVCVPVILKAGLLTTVTKYMNLVYPVLAVLGLARLSVLFIKRDKNLAGKAKTGFTGEEIALIVLFAVVVAFQVYSNIFMNFPDGDDAYYVAIALFSESADTMYRNEIYTGILSNINYRYAIAPFPMWIAFLARVTGIHAGVLSKTLLSTYLVLITYVIYYELSRVLFRQERNKRFAFLSLFSIAAMFGNYSISTAETFMLTRARQGKEALSSIVLPLLWLLILYVRDESCEAKGFIKTSYKNLILIIFCGIAGALSSVFGNILVLLVLFFWFLVCIFKYRSLVKCIEIAILAIPNLCIAFCYLLLN